jgi:glycosyltransferase involved in cell wall biosynthesis
MRDAVEDGRARGQVGRTAPRHVLFLIDQILALDGGAEGTLLKIVRALPRDRYRPSVGTFRLDPQLAERFPCPVHVFRLQRTYDWNAIKSALHLRHFIRSNRVTIVHTFFETADLWGGLVAKLSGCPLLISSRRDMGFQRSAKHRLAYRIVGSLFDQVHTVSDAVRDFAIQHDGLDPGRVITLHNGVDMQKVAAVDGAAELRLGLGLENASHLIVDVGWIRPVKGTDNLIRAAAIVCREFPNAVFLVIGDHDEEPYFRDLQALIASLRLSWNVRFLGSRDDVFRVFKICDIFCHPSRSDGLSNALLEAMACGLPCVAAGVGGNPEAIEEGESGFLVPIDDPAATAECVLRLLRDPDRARRMGERARCIAITRFSADLMVKKLLTLYEGLLKTRDDLGT